jgi:DNA polymerase III gamma/tau subunit
MKKKPTTTEPSEELYKRHRPSLFKQVLGQPAAIKSLTSMLEKNAVPHALLFTGPSGVGKTTLARIMQRKLGCADSNYTEINAANFRGIDTVRDVLSTMRLAPIEGRTRIYLLDEVHKLTSDAQNAFLKALEDTPEHVYFFLCTTEPARLIQTVLTRCTEIKLSALTAASIRKLVEDVTVREGFKLDDEVIDRLVEVANGSARVALVVLHKIAALGDDVGVDEQIAAIESSDFRAQSIDLARELTSTKATWHEVAKKLVLIEDDAEGVRRLVLAYCAKALISPPGDGKQPAGAKANAYESWRRDRLAAIISAFECNFYDSGRAGLVFACYRILSTNDNR